MLVSLGVNESNKVTKMDFVVFLIDTSSTNDGGRGANSYFRKLDNSEL